MEKPMAKICCLGQVAWIAAGELSAWSQTAHGRWATSKGSHRGFIGSSLKGYWAFHTELRVLTKDHSGVGPNSCSQNAGNSCKDPSYNSDPNMGTSKYHLELGKFTQTQASRYKP